MSNIPFQPSNLNTGSFQTQHPTVSLTLPDSYFPKYIHTVSNPHFPHPQTPLGLP